MRDPRHALALIASLVGLVQVVDTPAAHACGCLSPPVPIGDGQFAVNQSAEQIIFETEPGWVTAHVLIKYAGDPAKFAWLVPVPEVPTLGISPVSAFGVIDKLTQPNVTVDLEDLCPTSAWSCAHHEPLYCGGDDYGNASPNADAGFGGASDAGTNDPGVTVINEQVVGDYQTVTFRASEASSAVQWLRDNGFIVNQTTSIYMESYIQANMVFVAAKLVPGAGLKAIKPLKMRYRAAFPSVPLILTAVAAEPHLTVNAFIYGTHPFKPQGHPVVTIPQDRIAQDRKGRTNYPMVLARVIDEVGGDGFAIEYRGAPVTYDEFGNSMCCGTGYDNCSVGGNGKCECPRDEFDVNDCNSQGDIVDGIALLDSLKEKYTWFTRITTRVSAEEMRWDPAFESDWVSAMTGALQLRGSQVSLARCESQVIDKETFNHIDALQLCATTYCGPGGECTITNSGASCACGAGLVAQQFTDLDGKLSVTCVPEVPPVDLRAGGTVLPDACAGVTCGFGQCLDRNGIAVCKCDPGAAAVTGGSTPRCEQIVFTSQSPGAQDYSDPLRVLQVCAPPPPSCGAGGWLVKTGSSRPGVNCGGTEPLASDTIPPPKPSCPGFFGCGGCAGTTPAAPLPFIVGAWIVFAIVIRKRRRAR